MQDHKSQTMYLPNEAYKQLSNSKLDRKRIEDDARILANRIALLKYEDEKTLKKIDETRTKANQIYEMKIVHDERQQRKQKKIFVDVEQLKQNIIKQKNKSLTKKKKVFSFQERIFKENAKKIRLQSIANDELKIQQQEKSKKIQYLQSQLIRQQNEITKKKVEEFYQIKRLQNQCSLIKQSNQNEAIKIKREQEIQKMEQVEIGLINKLQKSQAMQKLAFQELENALALPHQEFAQKYRQKKMRKNKTQNISLKE